MDSNAGPLVLKAIGLSTVLQLLPNRNTGRSEKFEVNKLVVCEVPEARLSVNEKTTYSDGVYFNTKHDRTVYTQVEIS